MNTVHNARITLLANLLNTMAASSVAIGVLTPVAAVFFYGAGPAGLRWPAISFGILFWLLTSAVLHSLGQFVIRRLRE